jgi:hypothetical protein
LLQAASAKILNCDSESVDLDKIMVPDLAVKVMLEFYDDYKAGTHLYGQKDKDGKRRPMVSCSLALVWARVKG